MNQNEVITASLLRRLGGHVVLTPHELHDTQGEVVIVTDEQGRLTLELKTLRKSNIIEAETTEESSR